MWYVYIARCSDQSLYTGITTDIERREQEHNTSKKGAKFTRIRRPVEIVFFQKCENRSQASQLEYRMKQLSKAQKEEIINGKKELSLG